MNLNKKLIIISNEKTSINEDKICCENSICPEAWGENCETNEYYLEQFGFPGFGGKWYNAGGGIPTVFSSFDIFNILFRCFYFLI